MELIASPSLCRRRATVRWRVRIALALALLAALALPPARADSDHERVRAAVLAGEVLPLPVLLERLQRTHPGRVLEIELERDDGRWIYEIKLLQSDGQLLKLKLDAGSAQVLKVKRKGDGKDARNYQRADEARR